MQGVSEGSYLAGFGIREGDAIITVNGEDFDTIGEFAGLTKKKQSFVLQTFHIPDVRCE